MYIIYDLGRYTCTGTEDFFYKYQTLVLLPKHFFEYIKTKLITAPKMFFFYFLIIILHVERLVYITKNRQLCVSLIICQKTLKFWLKVI